MAPKKGKPIKKQAMVHRWPFSDWPNFPLSLLNSIAKNPRHTSNFRHPGGSIKSWASSTRRCRETRHPELPQLYELQGKPPPDFMTFPRKFVALNYNSRIFEVVVTGMSSPAFVVSKRPVEYPWIGRGEYKINCTEIDPYDANKQFMRFANAVASQDKFYAISLQGALVVVDDADACLVIRAIGAHRAVPSIPAKYFREYLFESDGEILLAFLIYSRTLTTADGVEVFRLDTSKLSWMKVESLEENALFLENESCIWVKSRQVGCRGNCVYFMSSQGGGDAGNEWCVYDMESGFISPPMASTSLPWNESL